MDVDLQADELWTISAVFASLVVLSTSGAAFAFGCDAALAGPVLTGVASTNAASPCTAFD